MEAKAAFSSYCSQRLSWLLGWCRSPRACKHFWVCVCVSRSVYPSFIFNACFTMFFFHPLPFSLPSHHVWPSIPTLHSLTSMMTVVSCLWSSSWCDFNTIPCLCLRVNGWWYFPNEILSLAPPPGESISPSHSQSFVPHIQIEKVNRAKESEGEDQTASVPCIEIHAVGVRRCSEPLSFIPQHHQTKPPAETESRLVITSEQRSLICFPQNHKLSPN